jgi:AraC-like DNA-binding protein
MLRQSTIVPMGAAVPEVSGPAKFLTSLDLGPVMVHRLRAAPFVDVFLLDLPADVVPVAPAVLETLLAVRFPGYGPVAQVLMAVLGQLTARTAAPPPADAVRLSTVVIELVGGVLATGQAVPADPTDAFLLRIHEYVDRHLEDAELTPPRIAAAHHVSVRRLHQLFRGQGITVAGWIRARRLDACRRDLADPTLDGRPVHAIAARWGFADESHFGRVFRAAYGIPPAAWRRGVRSRSAAT